MEDLYDEENRAAFREGIKAGIENGVLSLMFFKLAELAEERGELTVASENFNRAMKGLTIFVDKSRKG